MTPNGLNAAPTPPSSNSFADQLARDLGWDAATPSTDIEAPAPAGVAAPAADDAPPDLRDQLAELIQALAVDREPEPASEPELAPATEPAQQLQPKVGTEIVAAPKVEDEFCLDDFALPELADQYQTAAPAVEPVSVASATWQREIDEVAAQSKSMLSGRYLGFAAGLGASMAAGGAMLLFVGMSKPSAIAGNELAQDVPRFVDTTAIPEAPAPTKLQARVSQEPETQDAPVDIVQHGQEPAAAIRQTYFEGRPDGVSVVTPLIQAGLNAGQSDSGTASQEPAAVENVALASPDDGQLSIQTATEPSIETPAFETTVEPATEDTGAEAQVASAQGGGEPTRMAAVIEHVNMRAGPSTSAAVIGVVSTGSSVEVVKCSHWCEVIFAGQRGWVYSGFLNVGSNDVVVR